MDQYNSQNGFLNTENKEIPKPEGDGYSWSNRLVSSSYKKIPLAAFDIFSMFFVYCVCAIGNAFKGEYSDDFSDDFNN